MLGRKRGPEKNMWQRFRHDMRTRIVSGLLVIVPLGITVFALGFLYDLTAGKLSPYIQRWAGPMKPYTVVAISVLIFFLALYGVGFVANFVLGRKLLALTEMIIQRIPVVKTVYIASKQVIEGLAPSDAKGSAREVVLIDYPIHGMKAVGFVTGRIWLPDGNEYLKVFVPTVPNMSVGFVQMVALGDARYCKMPVEDAIKFIVSLGIIAPRSIALKPVAPSVPAVSHRKD